MVDEQYRATADAGGDAGHRSGSARDPVLEIRDVSVRFGGVAALTEVSLSVQAGEVTGLIGPNGAGKTTLFNVVSGLQRPDRGSVRIGGLDVTRFGPHRRARQGLARTFQRLELFGTLSAEDNVRVGMEARPRAGSGGGRRGMPAPAATATALLDRVGVSGVGGAPVNALSTGTARLVELARALSIEPRVLLLDEPSSGLDDGETAGLGRLLQELAGEGRSVLLVEHDVDLVLEICDVVHVLDFGEVIARGTPAQVRVDPAVQAAYLGKAGASPGAGGPPG